MTYTPKILPFRATQSLEDLKLIGFNCLNIVEVSSPCFSFNKDTLDILNSCENLPEGFELFQLVTRRIFPNSKETASLMEWFNDQKLIAWLPYKQPAGDIAYWIRIKVLA